MYLPRKITLQYSAYRCQKFARSVYNNTYCYSTLSPHCIFAKEIYYLFNFGYNFRMSGLLPAIALYFY